MVVGRNGQGLDTGVDEELGNDRLELGLPGFKVVTSDKGLVSFRELDASGNERVRGRAVDVGASFEDGRDCEQCRGGNFFVRVLDGVCGGISFCSSEIAHVLTHQVVRSVVDTINQLGIPLGIRRPEHDDLVQPVRRLEVSDILSDPLQMLRLVRTLD